MNAQEARKIATDVNTGKNAKQLKEIMLLIQQAVNNGDFSCNYYTKITPPVEQHLTKEGYKVNVYYDQRDSEYCVTISW